LYRSGISNGNSGIQVELEEDGGGGSKQNWVEKSGLQSDKSSQTDTSNQLTIYKR